MYEEIMSWNDFGQGKPTQLLWELHFAWPGAILSQRYTREAYLIYKWSPIECWSLKHFWEWHGWKNSDQREYQQLGRHPGLKTSSTVDKRTLRTYTVSMSVPLLPTQQQERKETQAVCHLLHLRCTKRPDYPNRWMLGQLFLLLTGRHGSARWNRELLK